MDLTRAAKQLLRHMADEHPTIALDEAAAETGLTPQVTARAMRQLCDGGYAELRERNPVRKLELADEFDITAAGRRIASRLA
jgi:predicted transcriptional regulator